MRVTLAHLLLCIPAAGFAEGFGDGILRKDWLPAPDHFQWPVLAEKKPKQEQKTRTLKELSESRRVIFRHYWPEDQLPGEFRFTITDLNADGLEEIFLPIPAYSGTGGNLLSDVFPWKESRMPRFGFVSSHDQLSSTKKWMVSTGRKKPRRGRALHSVFDDFPREEV